MTQQENLVSIGYFGKIPSRDDFIKAADNANLISVVDSWLTRSMELIATDPRWKAIYDSVPPMHFAVASTQTPRAVAGHLIASRDQAERRFPFISIGALRIEQPAEFLLYSPLLIGRLWNRLEIQTNMVVQAEDASEPLQDLCASDVVLNLGSQSYQGAFAGFMENHTLFALSEMLVPGGYLGDLRQLILALGLLLHPVMASGASRLDKSLVLPLPENLNHRYFVASVWMHFVSPFLFKADFELAIVITQMNDKHVLVIGFDGASARMLQAIMDPMTGKGYHIDFDDTSWVENSISADYRLEQLSSYLAQPMLQLNTALSHFKEIFLG